LGSTGLAPGKVWLETYGCQMNKAESEAILIALADAGWQVGESDEDADLVILNTCSVRETAEQRVRGRLGYYRHAKQRRPFTLVLTGCMAERLKGKVLDEFPEIDVVLGTFQKGDLLEALRLASGKKTPRVAAAEREYQFAHDHSTAGIKAFVPIMHGCNNWCSYCIVPRVRGPEISRPAAEVVDEIGRLDERGTAEVTLLGQNVNSYRFGAGRDAIDFPALLRMALHRAGSIRWVRFLTSHPKDLSEELLSVMAESPRMCRHVHLPLQSGSSKVLQAMRRGYTAERYLELVGRIRSVLPGVALSTDILIGFPGETEADFLATLRLVERIGFDEAFTYYYNPREGTPAFAMQDALPEPVKLERLARIIEAQRAVTSRTARERLGREVEVLVEGVSKKDPGELLARTEWDAMVVVPAERSRIGSFVRVRLASLSGSTYRAELVQQPLVQPR
jgi:tRNA-2-methylthio-N6-dimethylallyladenosine synthase